MSALEPLTQLLEGLREELDLEHVSMLIYAEQDRLGSAAILHVGQGQPLPELATLARAESLITGSLISATVISLPSSGSGQLLCLSQNRQRATTSELRRGTGVAPINIWLGIQCATPLEETQIQWLSALVPLCVAYYEQQFWQRDALTGLPGRSEFEREVARHLVTREHNDEPLALILFSPQSMSAWNTYLGRRDADLKLAAVAQALRSSVRDTDKLCRYGGATFGFLTSVQSHAATCDLANLVANRFSVVVEQQHTTELIIGGMWVAPGQPTDRYALVSGANRALRHARVEGHGSVQIIGDADIEPGESNDPLDGIFTGDLDLDYRAMRILWLCMHQLSESRTAANLLSQVADVLKESFALSEFGAAIQGELTIGAPHLPWQAWVELAQVADHPILGEHLQQELLLVRSKPPHNMTFWMLAESGSFTPSAQRLLNAVVSRVVQAYQDKIVSEHELARTQDENKRLHDTVQKVQHKGAATSYLFESSAMRTLLRQVETVAKTQETVLITGESGTGKEVIARTLHEASHLKDQKLVIVDCAAIPPTLFEAELFGRTKGAYTSAESASEGYIAKADGGTLFLDEVGELPIDVQAKLLRFLQEKEIRPVGSGETQSVDVRVIAATNRDLMQEVDAGRFRRDLYHRLCVLDLHIPPLRNRQADVLVLARHFVTNYAHLHGKTVTLSDEAENALVQCAWPGNVRELQHCLLRAVLLCETEAVTAADLQLPEGKVARAETELILPNASQSVLNRVTSLPEELGTDHAASSTEPLSATLELEAQLSQTVADCIATGVILPLGRWLADDIVWQSYEKADFVAKSAANTLRMAETTYRRQLEKIENERRSGTGSRPEHWTSQISTLLPTALQDICSGTDGTPVLLVVRAKLLSIVSEILTDDHKRAAHIMGVTVPTYRRYLEQMGEAA